MFGPDLLYNENGSTTVPNNRREFVKSLGKARFDAFWVCTKRGDGGFTPEKVMDLRHKFPHQLRTVFTVNNNDL
jgi:hypothetical protein